MRGGIRYKKHELAPDRKYQSILVSKLINQIMLDGKRETAEHIVYGALERLEQLSKKPALEAFELSIKNISPLLEVKSRRIGGATYQVPMEVRPDRKVTLAMRWITGALRNRQGKPAEILLAEELYDGLQNTGTAIKKREDLHKMAESNRAFAHFARF